MRSFLSIASLFIASVSAADHQIVDFRNPNDFDVATVKTTAATVTLLDLQAVTDKDGMLQHYGHPPEGCEDDEQALQIAGIPGKVCVPKCDAAGHCPTDVPDGVTAKPQCALENQSTGDKYCVLICHEAEEHNNLRLVGDAQCGDATCHMVQAGLGVCTYDS